MPRGLDQRLKVQQKTSPSNRMNSSFVNLKDPHVQVMTLSYQYSRHQVCPAKMDAKVRESNVSQSSSPGSAIIHTWKWTQCSAALAPLLSSRALSFSSPQHSFSQSVSSAFNTVGPQRWWPIKHRYMSTEPSHLQILCGADAIPDSFQELHQGLEDRGADPLRLRGNQHHTCRQISTAMNYIDIPGPDWSQMRSMIDHKALKEESAEVNKKKCRTGQGGMPLTSSQYTVGVAPLIKIIELQGCIQGTPRDIQSNKLPVYKAWGHNTHFKVPREAHVEERAHLAKSESIRSDACLWPIAARVLRPRFQKPIVTMKLAITLRQTLGEKIVYLVITTLPSNTLHLNRLRSSDPSRVERAAERSRSKRGDGQIPCPFKEEHGCNQMFTSQYTATYHARKCHGNSDPLRVERAQERSRAKRGNGKIPCPCRDEEECKTMFQTNAGAIKYAKEKHGYSNPDVPKSPARPKTIHFLSKHLEVELVLDVTYDGRS